METNENIQIFHTNLNNAQKEEDDFFGSKNSMCSVPEFYKQLFWKVRSLWQFDETIQKYKLDFAGKVLELGGGCGAHAAFLKSKYQNKIDLYYSDSSLNALKSSVRFENFFGTKIDNKWLIEAENIPTGDNTFDAIFFFASFHHIQNPIKSIIECYRVLKPQGKLYLIMEPACPKTLKRLYGRHTKRMEIKENNYTRAEYAQFLKTKFTTIKEHSFTSYYNRETKSSLLYYQILSILPNFIVNLLPCSQVIIAEKE